MGSFREPKLIEASEDLFLHSKIDGRESQSLIFSGLYNRETERLPFEFVRKNFDAIIKRLPKGGTTDPGASLVFVGARFCDEPSRTEFADFFGERVQQWKGGAQNYAQVIETIKTCEAHKAAGGNEINSYLVSR